MKKNSGIKNKMKDRNKTFLGDCIGVKLVQRGTNDKHVCVELLIEDDEYWHMAASFSSYYLDEAIEMLQAAKNSIETHCAKDGDCGWKFKE